MSLRLTTLRDARPPKPEDQMALPALLPELADAMVGTGSRLLVFGSRVRGDARQSSDLDAILVLPDGADWDWELKERLELACSAKGIRIELTPGHRVEPAFRDRVAAGGLWVAEGVIPALPVGWPPRHEAWDGQATLPRWLSGPIAHARENMAIAALEFGDSVAAAADLPRGLAPDSAARISGTLLCRGAVHGLEAVARGARRVMALFGEDLPREDPVDDIGVLMHLLGAATRGGSVFAEKRVRPPFMTDRRGDILSLADAASAARDGFVPLLAILPEAERIMAALAAETVPAFDRWLADLDFPRAAP